MRWNAPGIPPGLVLSCLALLLCACGGPDLARIGGDAPSFDPLLFFTGHTRSWGVLEDRSGAPSGVVTTDCLGTLENDGTLRMVQHLTMPDGGVTERTWHLRPDGIGSWQATANDMVGTAEGSSHGRVFHWDWTLATRPGDPLFDVTMSQWMYGLQDGSMLNRTQISKLGVILAEVTEQFRHVP